MWLLSEVTMKSFIFKLFTPAVIGFLLLSAPVAAEEKLLVDTATYDMLADVAVEQGAQSVLKSLGGASTMTPEEREAVRQAFREAWKETFPIEDWEKPLSKVYKKNLTDAEIEEISKFYASDLGKKVTKLQPELMKEMAAYGRKLGEERASKFSLKLFSKIAEKAAELENK